MRKYSFPQIVAFVLSFFLPPVAVWFTEGFGIDFWINVILTFLGYFPGSIHAIYIWFVWIERKWQTHHGKEVTTHPFLIFSKEFETRRYFDDNIKGGHGPNTVGGDVDLERARPIQRQQEQVVG
ncbi:hypothetical protein EG329_012767 [Mollisiaceae sp. DMI_Dod_QoI]|nr:hypothetical protein EG329_012767 [Helotiales sp. DMI_Dod_QoI]